MASSLRLSTLLRHGACSKGVSQDQPKRSVRHTTLKKEADFHETNNPLVSESIGLTGAERKRGTRTNLPKKSPAV